MPFIGSLLKARLLLLHLNPGFVPNELDLMGDRYYVAQNRRSLTFRSNVPFWLLDERLAHTPGHKYWSSKLRWLAKELGDGFVRHYVFCVQFFPYHSKEFIGPRSAVPSQQFAFDLVRKFMRKGRPILIMRARALWEATIPELRSYRPRYLLNGRNAAISPRNMGPGTFDELISRLRH